IRTVDRLTYISSTAPRKRARWLLRLKEKVTQHRLRLVCFGHFCLYEVGQNFGYPAGQRRAIVGPAPNRHFRDVEDARRSGVAAKDDFEEEIVPAAGQTEVEAR